MAKQVPYLFSIRKRAPPPRIVVPLLLFLLLSWPLFHGELSPRSGTFSFKFEIECRTLQLGKISAWVAAQESEVGQTSSQRGIARGKPYQLYEMGSFFGRSLPRSSSEVVHLFLFPHDPPSFPPLFRVLKIETLFHD